MSQLLADVVVNIPIFCAESGVESLPTRRFGQRAELVVGSQVRDVVHSAPHAFGVETKELTHADGVDHGVRTFGLLQNLTVGLAADGVKARGNQKNGLLPVNFFQAAQHLVKCVEKHDFVVHHNALVAQSFKQQVLVAGEIGDDFRPQIYFYQRSPVVFLQGVHEAEDRREDIVHVVNESPAELKHDDDCHRGVVGAERGNGLFHSVVKHLKVALLQASHKGVFLVLDDDVHAYQLNVDCEWLTPDSVFRYLRRRGEIVPGIPAGPLRQERGTGEHKHDSHEADSKSH